MSDQVNSCLRSETDSRFQEDWVRQRRTAADILSRLQLQEGVILADQVGMGKTYVALAVAVNQILSTPRHEPVVIFVPAAVADKWVREWKKFSETLLEHDVGIRCVAKPIRSGEEFLKKLDDKRSNRDHVIVVTHSALTSTLKDAFIQLAFLYFAIQNMHGGASLRQRIAKWSTGQSGLIRDQRFNSKRVEKLLGTPPAKWHATWKSLTGVDLPDDPVPTALREVSRQLPYGELRIALKELPQKKSRDIDERLKSAREELSKITQTTWSRSLSSIELELPLIIVDEAHRLKNPRTLISQLFRQRSCEMEGGAFNGIFRKMLFLTATPFELGHSELIEIISRMGAVRPSAPPTGIPLKDRIKDLEKVLNEAHASALAFDAAWGRLRMKEDVAAFDQWAPNKMPPTRSTAAVNEAWEQASFAVESRRKMHVALRPWIIRHERQRRRIYYPGAAILNTDNSLPGGLPISENSVLPFLLAARTQSVELDEKRGRPLFAYGIASSYEAFAKIESSESENVRDSDLSQDDREESNLSTEVSHELSGAFAWYKGEIDRALDDPKVRYRHPKVRATVERAVHLWREGEKCLIFSWFIKTGEVIDIALRVRIESIVLEMASKALGTESEEQTKRELDRLADRLFRRDRPAFDLLRTRLKKELIGAAGKYSDVVDLVIDSGIRHLRTPSYLVRYTPLSIGMTIDDVWEGINGNNTCGIKLIERWSLFAERLARARAQIVTVNTNEEQDSEFVRIRAALLGTFSEDDQGARRGASLSPVRRAHGGTERDDRERLIALFNTPLSPEILVASSVMGEGIDLHQECRFVIHHDLDWNPSVIEQRTGRLDRIGALAERVKLNIEIFEPYLAGTHDEKMFRVVKDRAQWFDVVMGRPTSSDERVTDAEETRLPLHSKIRDALSMDLRSPE